MSGEGGISPGRGSCPRLCLPYSPLQPRGPFAGSLPRNNFLLTSLWLEENSSWKAGVLAEGCLCSQPWLHSWGCSSGWEGAALAAGVMLLVSHFKPFQRWKLHCLFLVLLPSHSRLLASITWETSSVQKAAVRPLRSNIVSRTAKQGGHLASVHANGTGIANRRRDVGWFTGELCGTLGKPACPCGAGRLLIPGVCIIPRADAWSQPSPAPLSPAAAAQSLEELPPHGGLRPSRELAFTVDFSLLFPGTLSCLYCS